MQPTRMLFFAACLTTGLATIGAAQPSPVQPTLLTQERQTPDIVNFMHIGSCAPAGYTWDGETVFFTSQMSGSTQVYRLDRTGWPHQLTVFEDGIDFFALSWGGTLAVVGASVGGSEQSQLFLLDTRTSRIVQLTHSEGVRFDGVVWAKDDASILYSSNEENLRDFNIFAMNIATGESRKVFGDAQDLGGSKWIDDISQDGSKIIVVRWNSNADSELFLVDIATGNFERLTPESDIEIIYSDVTLMPDNKTIYLISNARENGMKGLARMRLESRDLEFITDGWLEPRWEVESLTVSRDYRYMSAVVNQEGYLRLKMREIESGRELPSPPLDGQLGGGIFDQQGDCLVSFNGPTRAPDVWRWNPRTQELTQLTFSSYAGIDRELFSEPQLVKIRSFDSLEIPAFLYLPPDYAESQPIPFIVHAHGGPESQFNPEFIRNIQYLILNGYGVLAVNPRGSSGYGREYMALDNYKLRKNSLKDYKAATDWLIEKAYTRKGMIGIRGGSYGGYVVLGMITEYPDLYSAAIDDVGIANFQTFLQNTSAYRRHLREAEYGPLSDPEFLAEISPIHKADQIRTPLLVVHGANDPRVPVDEARQIIAAIQANGGEVDSLIFQDEGHGSGKRDNTIIEYRQQIAFLEKYLKSATPQPATTEQ